MPLSNIHVKPDTNLAGFTRKLITYNTQTDYLTEITSTETANRVR